MLSASRQPQCDLKSVELGKRSVQGRRSDGRAGGDHELKGNRDLRQAKLAKNFGGSGSTPRGKFLWTRPLD